MSLKPSSNLIAVQRDRLNGPSAYVILDPSGPSRLLGLETSSCRYRQANGLRAEEHMPAELTPQSRFSDSLEGLFPAIRICTCIKEQRPQDGTPSHGGSSLPYKELGAAFEFGLQPVGLFPMPSCTPGGARDGFS